MFDEKYLGSTQAGILKLWEIPSELLTQTARRRAWRSTPEQKRKSKSSEWTDYDQQHQHPECRFIARHKSIAFVSTIRADEHIVKICVNDLFRDGCAFM